MLNRALAHDMHPHSFPAQTLLQRRGILNPGFNCEGVGTGQAGDKSQRQQFQQDALQFCCTAAAVWARLGCDRTTVAGKTAQTTAQALEEQAALCRDHADPTAAAPVSSDRTPDTLFQVLFAATQIRQIRQIQA